MKDEVVSNGGIFSIDVSNIDRHPYRINVGVKRVNLDAPKPKYNKEGDSGFDFVAMESAIITPGQTVQIPIGLAFELPLGTEIQIRPRSGVSAKTKVRVTLGTIDSNYRGELKVNIDNIIHPEWVFNRDTSEVEIKKGLVVHNLEGGMETVKEHVPVGSIIVHKGQRIAQGVIALVFKGIFNEKEDLSETVRGSDGFGSSGV